MLEKTKSSQRINQMQLILFYIMTMSNCSKRVLIFLL